MKNLLARLDKGVLKKIKEVSTAAHRRGIRCFLVGGCVRDILLRKRSFDIDIVVEGDALVLASELAKVFKARVLTYEQFGTATLQFSLKQRIDLASARKETYPFPGALPVVSPGTLKDDLYRRDFTINALAISLNEGSFGLVIDEFGGKKDLKKKAIRNLHDKSFLDDPTRVLRAIRFEKRLGFQMEGKTLRLLKEAIRKNYYEYVKPPRYFVEFKKILKEGNTAPILRRLKELEAYHFLDKSFKIDLRAVFLWEKRLRRLKTAYSYELRQEKGFVLFLGILRMQRESVINEVLSKFHFTQEERLAIFESRQIKLILKNLSRKKLSPSAIWQLLRSLEKRLIFFLRLVTPNVVLTKRIDRYLMQYSSIRLSVGGEDLKKMGVGEGKEMGRILHYILRDKIDGKVKGYKEELKLAQKLKSMKE